MYNQGIVRICSLENTAESGMMPSEQLVVITEAYYDKRSKSVNRIYSAIGANRQFDALIRCYNTDVPDEGMYVIFENDDQYQIDICQEIVGKDCIDLTLIKVEDYYDVAEPET